MTTPHPITSHLILAAPALLEFTISMERHIREGKNQNDDSKTAAYMLRTLINDATRGGTYHE